MSVLWPDISQATTDRAAWASILEVFWGFHVTDCPEFGLWGCSSCLLPLLDLSNHTPCNVPTYPSLFLNLHIPNLKIKSD
jgi:hypothetical protein